MATDVYTDAIQKSAGRITKVIDKNAEDPMSESCSYCNDPRCSGSHNHPGDKKNKNAQVLQRIQDNPVLDWRQRHDNPDEFVAENFHRRLGETHQVIRDNPMVQGAIKNERAHVMGSKVRLSYNPDYESLGQSIEWSMKIAAQVEDLWEREMEDPVYCWNDTAGDLTFSGQMGLSFMEGTGSGEALNLFIADPTDFDHKPFTMTTSQIDVSRLSTPFKYKSDNRVRHGKRLNKHGRVQNIYISNEIPGVGVHNRFTSRALKHKQLKWKSVRPFSLEGTPQYTHWFDKERVGQTRASADLAAGLKRVHMLETYEETIIDAAVRDAAFAMWVESNSPTVGQAFTTNPGMSPGEYVEEVLGATTEARTEYYKDRQLELQAGKGLITQLMTDETMKSMSPGSPNDNAVNFGRAMQVAMARALGIDPYTLHGDMTGVNFSTIRASQLQTWVNRHWKRDQIFTYMGTPIFSVWFEEKVARGDIKMPVGRNTRQQLQFFYNNRRALTMVEFNGPGQESIDPIKGFRAQEGAIKFGLQTRDIYYKQFTNTTFRKAVARLAYEKKLLKENDLAEYTSEIADSGIGGQASDRVDEDVNDEGGDGGEDGEVKNQNED